MKIYYLQVKKIAISIAIVNLFFPKNCPPPPSQPMKFRLSPFPFQMINPTCDLYSDWFFGFSYFDLPQYVLLLLSTCSHPMN